MKTIRMVTISVLASISLIFAACETRVVTEIPKEIKLSVQKQPGSSGETCTEDTVPIRTARPARWPVIWPSGTTKINTLGNPIRLMVCHGGHLVYDDESCVMLLGVARNITAWRTDLQKVVRHRYCDAKIDKVVQIGSTEFFVYLSGDDALPRNMPSRIGKSRAPTR